MSEAVPETGRAGRKQRARCVDALTAAVLIASAGALPAAPAGAHGQKPSAGDGRIEAVLDPLPEALAHVRVQIHDTLAPQLAVHNDGAEALEILDAAGVAFLRLGPAGAEANLSSLSWYRTASPSDAVPIPAEVLAASAAGAALPARWRRIADEPAWGWFDRRIETDTLRVANAQHATGETAELGRWTIPLRVGDRSAALTGRFVFRPAAAGSVRIRLASDAEIAPGVRLTVLSGRGGGLFLSSRSERVVTVLGQSGEPFLRIAPSGVEANLYSPTFAEAARLRGRRGPALGESDPEERGAGEALWQRVSSAPRYGWIDPRTAPPDPIPAAVRDAGARAELRRWSVPVRIGAVAGDATAVAFAGAFEGVTLWEPRSPAPSPVAVAR